MDNDPNYISIQLQLQRRFETIQRKFMISKFRKNIFKIEDNFDMI